MHIKDLEARTGWLRFPPISTLAFLIWLVGTRATVNKLSNEMFCDELKTWPTLYCSFAFISDQQKTTNSQSQIDFRLIIDT